MKGYNQTSKTPESELRFFTYVSEYGGSPKPGIISSRPSTGGEYTNMYGYPTDRKHLIEVKENVFSGYEGDLMGICSKTNKLCKFNVIDDTYIVQIPSIIKLKEALDKIPNTPIDPNWKVKSRFRK